MVSNSYESELIRDSARRLFAADFDLGFVRAFNEQPERQCDRLLAQIQEMGWQGLVIEETHGGVGYGFNELCGLLHEHGFAAMPPLFFAHHVAPVLCLNAFPASTRKADLLSRIAEGACVPAVAADSATLQSFSGANSVRATAAGKAFALTGTVNNLVSAEHAAEFLVPARVGKNVIFVSVDTRDPSLVLTPRYDKSFGHTHSLTFHDTPVPDGAVISENAGEPLTQAYALCAVAKSAELIGGAERAMQFAVEHVGNRKQFGKYLAEFQAVQHQAADMFKAIEVAGVFLREAVESIDAGQRFDMAAHCCKAWSNQANFQATKTSHQLMGGTGYMMETDLHLLTLHGLRNEYEFGSTDHHKESIAGLLGL